MIRLYDRIKISLGAGMGFEVASTEVEHIACMVVVLQNIRDAAKPGSNLHRLASSALKPIED